MSDCLCFLKCWVSSRGCRWMFSVNIKGCALWCFWSAPEWCKGTFWGACMRCIWKLNNVQNTQPRYGLDIGNLPYNGSFVNSCFFSEGITVLVIVTDGQSTTHKNCICTTKIYGPIVIVLLRLFCAFAWNSKRVYVCQCIFYLQFNMNNTCNACDYKSYN